MESIAIASMLTNAPRISIQKHLKSICFWWDFDHPEKNHWFSTAYANDKADKLRRMRNRHLVIRIILSTESFKFPIGDFNLRDVFS